MNEVTRDFSFSRGWVVSPTIIVFNALDDSAVAQDVPGSVLFIFKSPSTWTHRIVPWHAVDVVATNQTPPTVLMMGKRGEVLVGGSDGFQDEQIRVGDKLPADVGALRQLRAVGDTVFALGMGRQLFARRGAHNWQSFAQVLPARPVGKVRGFNAISGTGPTDLTVVGWAGEMLHFNGTSWEVLDSPTNVALFDVVCVPGGSGFACGQAGALLKLQNQAWAPLEYSSEAPLGDLRSLAWFREKLWVSDGYHLYSLNGNRLDMVEFGQGEDIPSAHLHSSGELLLSVAPKDLYTTVDGSRWNRLPQS